MKSARIYTVYLNYGYDNEKELFDSTNKDEALDWAEDHSDSEIGPGDSMEVIWFADDGEAMTEWLLSYEDME